MRPSLLSGFLVSFMRVVGSTVVGRHSAVLVGGEGAVGDLDSDDETASGESAPDAEAYGAPGIVFRPRPPDASGDQLAAEAMAVRLGGKLTPVAWRDLRLNRRYPEPKAGSVALVGYGGAFLSFDDAASSGPEDGKASKATLYVPYAYAGGTATKAHVLAFDPDGESVMLVHGDGFAVVLDKDNGITMRADSTTWLNLKPGEFTVCASKVVLQGNVALGANPTAAVPLLAGPASPPSPSVFVSPV